MLVPAAAALLVGAPVLALATATWTRAATISILMAVVALSLVVVTGYVGQVSLVHMAFVGVAAFVVSKLSSDLGWPFPLPIVAGALLATTLGLVLGLPSVRVRGPSLAIVTLAAALALDRVLFQNPSVTGRFEGSRVAAPSLFGWELGPRWFAILSLGALVLIASLVANLRRSALGRRFIAVRENERAAAAAGIGVAQTKLTGFAASAFVAGLAGGLLAYHLRIIGFERFGPIASLHVVLQAYLGGIGMISGAVVAGLLANGGVFSNVVSRITAIESFESVLMAVLLLVTLTTHPDGIASLLRDRVGHVRSSRPRPHPGGVGTATSSGPASTRRPSAMDDQSEGRSHAHT
ncbi:MAG: branched-chain amino acid ABC transporter permease [Acidimicrobiia bacterium]|nr:branched-chain amino acid ABC transporter permease [Acidimicrobiia bacterium]